MQNKNRYYSLFLAAIFVFIDQALKYYFLKNFSFTSLNADLGFSLKFFSPLILNVTVLTCFVLAVIIFDRKKITSFPFVLITSGAISNIIDRLYRGAVVDFIDLKFWPSFNLADVLISLGALWFVIDLLRKN